MAFGHDAGERRDPDPVVEPHQHAAGCSFCQAVLGWPAADDSDSPDRAPELDIEGPPPDGDVVLQRVIREVRDETERERPRGRSWFGLRHNP